MGDNNPKCDFASYYTVGDLMTYYSMGYISELSNGQLIAIRKEEEADSHGRD